MKLNDFKQSISLKPYNTLAVDVGCEYFYALDNITEIPAIMSLLTEQQLPLHVIGGGSNIILLKDLPGLVLNMANQGVELVEENATDVRLKIAAGQNWHQTVLHCHQAGYYGLENLALIPGTVGAAPVQNIGAYGVELADIFVELEGWDIAQKQWRTLSLHDCDFAYRDSVFKNALKNAFIISSVTLKLNKQAQVKSVYPALQNYLVEQAISEPSPADILEAVITIRQSKLPDPKDLPNAGSFFKNPIVDNVLVEKLKKQYLAMPVYPVDHGRSKLAAGWLLEQAGWKGKGIGNIGMHHLQSLVLINYKKGDGQEILAFAELIKNDIQFRFGVELAIEPIQLP